MAKKIECTVYDRTGWNVITLIRDSHDTEEASKATLIIHPKGKKRERVFTESEVNEAIERRIDALPDTLSVEDYQRIRDVLSFFNPRITS